MYIFTHQNAAGSKVTVTSTATNIFDLINTAASTTLANAGFPAESNAIDLTVEDGDIRVLFDNNDPTSSNGVLLSSGNTYFFRGVPLSKLKLIRAGSSDVACSLQVGKSDEGESTSANAYAVTLETGSSTLSIAGNAAHDDTDSGNPVGIGGNAQSSQASAVSAGDRVRGVFNLFGELVIAGYDWVTNAIRVSVIDPISQHYVNNSVDVDTTNVTAGTHYYPSSTGGTMDGYKGSSLTGKLLDLDDTLTLTLQVSNDEDATNADWNDVYFYDDNAGSNTNSKSCSSSTTLLSLSMNNNFFRRYRWKLVVSTATNTVILKERKVY